MSHIRQNSFGLLVKINEMSTCNPFVEFQKEMYALKGGGGAIDLEKGDSF